MENKKMLDLSYDELSLFLKVFNTGYEFCIDTYTTDESKYKLNRLAEKIVKYVSENTDIITKEN